jgi:hypothetical protein
MKHLVPVLPLLVLLSACGKATEFVPPTIPQLERIGAVANAGAEATPILFNGQKYIVSFSGRQGAVDGGIVVADFQGNVISRVVMPDMGTGSAIVENGVVYVYGSTGVTQQGTLTTGNEIRMSTSVDLFNWTPPVAVIRNAADVGSANTSVAKTPTGYVMAYDFFSPGLVNYSYKFAVSDDLIHWRETGGVFRADRYTSCPTIRWVNDQYYLFFLEKAKQENAVAYYTRLARSSDLVNFEYQTAPYAVVSPDNTEGLAVTDIDVLEDAGVTYFIYSAGDQQTWGEERLARYAGTLSEFVRLFF